MSEIFLGSHLGLGSPLYYLGTVKQAVEFNENTFMFYTGAPQNTRRMPLASLRIPEGRAFLKEHGFDESKIVVHAPYIINLGNKNHADTYDLAKSFLKEELKRVEAFGLSLLVLHPGSSTGESAEFGVQSVIEGLNDVLEDDPTHVTIALETMAGKGFELGRTFEELATIRQGVKHQERIGFCLDTCHINDYGMNDKDIDGVLEHFDKVLGLQNLKVIHLNDSKNPQGSHKDRHENIGYGTIGFDTLEKWVKDPRLVSIPKILETPVFEDKYPYKQEIEMLRSGNYVPNWREKL